LGTFRLFQAGQLVKQHGGKTEALLSYLAVRHTAALPRTVILDAVWPDHDAALAGEALRSRIKDLHRLLSAAFGGAAPLLHEAGCYRLNVASGVGVDVAHFDALVTSGDRQAQAGRTAEAAIAYQHAVQFWGCKPKPPKFLSRSLWPLLSLSAIDGISGSLDDAFSAVSTRDGRDCNWCREDEPVGSVRAHPCHPGTTTAQAVRRASSRVILMAKSPVAYEWADAGWSTDDVAPISSAGYPP
jgi:hypothetical protein